MLSLTFHSQRQGRERVSKGDPLDYPRPKIDTACSLGSLSRAKADRPANPSAEGKQTNHYPYFGEFRV